MGQYHVTVNLDKREFLDPHKLGDGLKLWEQLNSQGGVMAALHILLACSNGRGGGDIEEHEMVGRWAGDRVAVVGDYAEDGDLAPEHQAALIHDLCGTEEARQRVAEYRRERAREAREAGDIEKAEEHESYARRLESLPLYRDISDEVVPLVEAACEVSISGTGWRNKEPRRKPATVALRPDMVMEAGPPPKAGEKGGKP